MGVVKMRPGAGLPWDPGDLENLLQGHSAESQLGLGHGGEAEQET